MSARIAEDGSLMPLPDEVLKKYGFKKIHKLRDKEEGCDAGYTHRMRIHDMIHLYDRHGFVTIEQFREKGFSGERKLGAQGYNNDFHITIPNPIRTDEDLKQLLNAILI